MTDKEKAVAELQQWLRNISKSKTDDPSIIPDGIYSEETRIAVEEFQRNNSLEITGITDFATWEAIKSADRQVTASRELPSQVAPVKNEDLPLKKGDNNPLTDTLKLMLNHLSELYENFYEIYEQGFGNETEKAVRAWQKVIFVKETGEADKETWNSLASFYLLK